MSNPSFIRRLWPGARPAPRVPDGRRIYAIGDVHGRIDLFGRLIEMIESDMLARGPAEGWIVILGDIIDRGPDSAELVDLMRTFVDTTLNITILKGNHEAIAVAALRGEAVAMRQWLAYGGDAALMSWGASEAILFGDDIDAIMAEAQARVPAEVIDWLDALPLTLTAGDYLFVHAGVRPGVPIEAQEADDLLWIRGDFLDSRADHGAMIVHGHTSAAEAQLKRNRIGIDTGACWTGRLTALGLEGEARWFLST